MANLIPISTVVVGSGGAASISFSSIPGTYTDLVVKLSARTTDAGTSWQNILIRPNGATTSQSDKYVYGTGSVAASSGESNIKTWANQGGTTSSTFANSEIYIPNYAGSNNKSFSIDAVTEQNGTSALTFLGAALWSSSSAITSITLTPDTTNFAQYSTATLYGIRKY